MEKQIELARAGIARAIENARSAVNAAQTAAEVKLGCVPGSTKPPQDPAGDFVCTAAAPK